MKKEIQERAINGVEVYSAGTRATPGIGPLPKVLQVCEEKGIDISSHISRPLEEEMVKTSDMILVMEDEHLQYVVEKFPEAEKKTKIFSDYSKEFQGQNIQDPIGGGIFGFKIALSILDECVKKLLDEVLNKP